LNVIRFYGNAPLFLIKDSSQHQLKQIFNLDVGGVIHRGELRTELTKDLFDDSGLCFAGVIPSEVFKGSAKEVAGIVKDFLQLKIAYSALKFPLNPPYHSLFKI